MLKTRAAALMMALLLEISAPALVTGDGRQVDAVWRDNYFASKWPDPLHRQRSGRLVSLSHEGRGVMVFWCLPGIYHASTTPKNP